MVLELLLCGRDAPPDHEVSEQTSSAADEQSWLPEACVWLLQDDSRGPKKSWKFLQKYWHKGAFFQDEGDAGKDAVGGDTIFRRDYSAPTGDDKMDKTVLPKVRSSCAPTPCSVDSGAYICENLLFLGGKMGNFVFLQSHFMDQDSQVVMVLQAASQICYQSSRLPLTACLGRGSFCCPRGTTNSASFIWILRGCWANCSNIMIISLYGPWLHS